MQDEIDGMDKYQQNGFIDTFRYLNPEQVKYSWWSYRANSRNNNKGWRIDYLLVSESLRQNLVESYILDDVVHSDHCPIGVNIKI